MSNSVQQEFTEFVFSIEAKNRQIPDRDLAKKAISLLKGMMDNPRTKLNDKTVRNVHYQYFHVEEDMVRSSATRLSLFCFSYLLNDKFSQKSMNDVRSILEMMMEAREVNPDHRPEASEVIDYVKRLLIGVTEGVLVGIYAAPSDTLKEDVLRSCHVICSELWKGIDKIPYLDLMTQRLEIHIYHDAELQSQDVILDIPKSISENLIENDSACHQGVFVKAFIDSWSEHMTKNLETIPELMVEQGLRYFFPEESERAKAEHLMHLGGSNLEQLETEPSDKDNSPVNNFLI